MTLVVDASVALKWVIPEQGSEAAAELHAFELTAPSIWLAEAANVLWRHVLRGELEPSRAERLFAELTMAPVTTTPLEEDLPAALRLTNELRHPIYDCLYLAAALRIATHVVTADRRFVHACSKNEKLSRHVKLLGTRIY